MAQADVINPKRLQVSNKPNQFETNHINRIRRANSKSHHVSFSSSNEIKKGNLKCDDLNTVNKKEGHILLNSSINKARHMKIPVNLKIINRRRSSEANHINRIREASSKRRNPEFPTQENKTGLKNESNHTFEDTKSPKRPPFESPFSSKNNMISKWLRGISDPDYEVKQNDKNPPKMKRSSVQILKISENTNTNNKIDNQKFSSDKKKPTATRKRRNVNSKKNEKSIDTQSQLVKSATNSTEVSARELSGVEMNVTELGILQIVFNPKSFSSDDSAILIWIDNIPKTFFVPDYHRRLSLIPKHIFQSENVSTDIIKSKSESHLKDIAVSNPNVYFPRVTVLKNIKVDTETKLERLSDFSSGAE